MTTPERIILAALIITATIQLFKFCVPLLNGWGALLANGLMTAVTLYVFFPVPGSLREAAAIFGAVALAAAGIHGTMTKMYEYPSPRENPTPSGTPRQNHAVN
jgi:hypothetical protein